MATITPRDLEHLTPSPAQVARSMDRIIHSMRQVRHGVATMTIATMEATKRAAEERNAAIIATMVRDMRAARLEGKTITEEDIARRTGFTLAEIQKNHALAMQAYLAWCARTNRAPHDF